MGKINLGRVILGGIVAGDHHQSVRVCFERQWCWRANGPPSWPRSTGPQVGMNQIIVYNVMSFVLGIAAVWTYAAIRPRFGAGVKTRGLCRAC